MIIDNKAATILVVDDDDIDYGSIEQALQTLKIANLVKRAKDGVEALDILRGTNGQEKLLPPYIIFLDLNMPRMNGIEFLDALREDEALRSSLVFVLTTSDADRDIVETYRRNIAGYILKHDIQESLSEALSSLQDYQWSIFRLPQDLPKNKV